MIENIGFNIYDYRSSSASNSDTDTAESDDSSSESDIALGPEYFERYVPFKINLHRTFTVETLSINDYAFPDATDATDATDARSTTNSELQNTQQSLINRCISVSNYLLPLARGVMWAIMIIAIQRANS